MALAVITTACGGAHTLAPLSLPSSSLGRNPVAWLSPHLERDSKTLARWRAGVGSPLVLDTAPVRDPGPVDAITVVSWNVALDGGDVLHLVRELQGQAPGRPIVLLLQEAFRSGDDVPGSAVEAKSAQHLGRCDVHREIDDIARVLGFSAYYVPSMRNGSRYGEDRGNAVLSSLPLEQLTAIELPFEHQRRVAVAATIGGLTSRGEPWSLRLASVHLDNLVGARNGWIATEYGRARQARGLRQALTAMTRWFSPATSIPGSASRTRSTSRPPRPFPRPGRKIIDGPSAACCDWTMCSTGCGRSGARRCGGGNRHSGPITTR